MLEGLKESVCRANYDIIKSHLVTLTWGNVSGFDKQEKLIVIKPSGLSYEELKPECMVVVDLKGSKVEGDLKPSSDTPTHIELYKAFDGIGSIVHTHSDYASMFAQAGKGIPCLGTTHADHFHGSVPVTRSLKQDEVETDYEKNTGSVIIETFEKLDPLACPAVLVSGHGPFTWGKTPGQAVEASIALEKVAKMAWGTLALTSKERALPGHILKKHYLRKHGPNAYYGQKGGKEDE